VNGSSAERSLGQAPAVGRPNQAGKLLLGLGAGVLGHVLCVAAFLLALLVSTVLLAVGDSDDSGDRAQARAAIAVLIIGLAVLALAEVSVLVVAAVQLRRGRRHFAAGMLAGWVVGVLTLALYASVVWFPS
jgi:hypothetical protein